MTMKTYKVRQTVCGLSKTRIFEKEGTLEELVKCFKYILEVGYSYNRSINTNPKTIKSFISNVNKALEEEYNYPAYIELVD